MSSHISTSWNTSNESLWQKIEQKMQTELYKVAFSGDESKTDGLTKLPTPTIDERK